VRARQWQCWAARDHDFTSAGAACWLVLPCVASLPAVGVAEGSREAKTIRILQPLHFCVASLGECEFYLSLAMGGSAAVLMGEANKQFT